LNPSEETAWQSPAMYPLILMGFQKAKKHAKSGHRLLNWLPT